MEQKNSQLQKEIDILRDEIGALKDIALKAYDWEEVSRLKEVDSYLTQASLRLAEE